MKKLFLLLFASVVLAACGKDSYKIKGSISGVEDGTVMTLSVMGYDGLVDLDSAVVKGGKFVLSGTTDTAEVSVITFFVDDNIRGCQLFLERGVIDVDIDIENGTQRLAGTPNNDAFQKFYDDTQVLSDEADEIEDKIRITLASKGDCTSLYEQMGELQDRFKVLLAQSIEENADKAFGYQQLMENYSMFEPDEVMGLLEKLAPAFGSDIAFNQLTAIITAQLATSLGHEYVDVEGFILSKDNKYEAKASLSDYVKKNKVVLLDFWASWCTPCMNEVPNLKAAYKKFHSKGFEIVSISVDEDTQEWIKAVRNNDMNWVQLWNGFEDMAQSAAAKYQVTAIPSTYLIDSEGTIIGRNLRDNELEKALEDYFK